MALGRALSPQRSVGHPEYRRADYLQRNDGHGLGFADAQAASRSQPAKRMEPEPGHNSSAARSAAPESVEKNEALKSEA